jgi:hypothetical protein
VMDMTVMPRSWKNATRRIPEMAEPAIGTL